MDCPSLSYVVPVQEKLVCRSSGITCAHQLWLRVSDFMRLLDALADSVDPLRNVEAVAEEQTSARQAMRMSTSVLHLTSVFASAGTGTSCNLDRPSSFVSPTTAPLSTFLNKLLRNVVATQKNARLTGSAFRNESA